MGKSIYINGFVLVLMFMLLPVDMVNGILLKNNINLPLSVGQLHKLIIILFIFISFLPKPNKLLYAFFLFIVLITPSVFQVFSQLKIHFLFADSIKITRYLMPVFSFMFFVNLIKTNNSYNLNLMFRLIKFSYIIFSINILLKYLGLGYPLYEYGDIGSKGFFFAGNETSVVLIILSSIIAYKLWLDRKVKKYILFFLFTMLIGLTISSKTGMLGVVITFLLIPLNLRSFKFSVKKMLRVLVFIIVVMPLLILAASKFIAGSPIFVRFRFFWEKLDFVTFMFSNRNNFFAEGLKMYSEDYNFFEKIIGVGQTQYETLNGNAIIEMDIVDIFFAYGIMGTLLFVFLISYIWLQSRRFARTNNYPFARFVGLMIVLLLGISTIAGHVYSSGMAAIFLGLLFSLMYIKNNQIEN